VGGALFPKVNPLGAGSFTHLIYARFSGYKRCGVDSGRVSHIDFPHLPFLKKAYDRFYEDRMGGNRFVGDFVKKDVGFEENGLPCHLRTLCDQIGPFKQRNNHIHVILSTGEATYTIIHPRKSKYHISIIKIWVIFEL